MTAADTMGPFLYLSIQHSLSPPSHLPSCPAAAAAAATPQFFPPFLASPLLLFSPFLGRASHPARVRQDAHLLLSARAQATNECRSRSGETVWVHPHRRGVKRLLRGSSIIPIRYSSEGRKKKKKKGMRK